MWGRQRLVRYDPRVPTVPPGELRAEIDSVQFAATNRHRLEPGSGLGRLPFSDNSLVFSFAAPANPFGGAVAFEVRLEGAMTDWVSMGGVGSATYSRLKEGRYVFHVRPVRGGRPGIEDSIAFTIEPPWFRTRLAWLLYIAGFLGIVALAAWLSSYLQHREKQRLERVVNERTGELNATNAQLGRQIAETTEKSRRPGRQRGALPQAQRRAGTAGPEPDVGALAEKRRDLPGAQPAAHADRQPAAGDLRQGHRMPEDPGQSGRPEEPQVQDRGGGPGKDRFRFFPQGDRRKILRRRPRSPRSGRRPCSTVRNTSLTMRGASTGC